MAPDGFDLEAALAGLPDEQATRVKEQWGALEKGFTQATQRESEWRTRAEEGQRALSGYETFYKAWAEQQESIKRSGVKPDEPGARRAEYTLPEEYDPAALTTTIRGMLSEEFGRFNTARKAQDDQLAQGLLGNTEQMLRWQATLNALKTQDPEMDEQVVIKRAAELGTRDLGAAYEVAYGKKNMERVAKQAATLAADEARKEAEARVRKELQGQYQAQIEGASTLTSSTRRVVDGKRADVPKSRSEAENAATQALYGKMFDAR